MIGPHAYTRAASPSHANQQRSAPSCRAQSGCLALNLRPLAELLSAPLIKCSLDLPCDAVQAPARSSRTVADVLLIRNKTRARCAPTTRTAHAFTLRMCMDHFELERSSLLHINGCIDCFVTAVLGKKKVLGHKENQGVKFRLSFLAELRQRSDQDIYIPSMIGLKGLPGADNARFRVSL